MKKFIFIVIIAVCLIGCGNNDKKLQSNSKTSELENLKKSCYSVNEYEGVTMEFIPEDITNDRIVVVVTNNSADDICFGDWFEIEICENGIWYEVEKKRQAEFDDIGYWVESNDKQKNSFNYEYLYDLNESSIYRVIKCFFVGEEKYYISAEFKVNANNPNDTSQEKVTRLDQVDSIIFEDCIFDSEELNYTPYYSSEDWMDEDGNLLFPYENHMDLMDKYNSICASLYIPEDVLLKASTEELLKVVYDGWFSTGLNTVLFYEQPWQFMNLSTGRNQACNEVLRRSDMVELVYEDYCKRDYPKGNESDMENLYEVDKLQFDEMVLASNYAFSLMDEEMKSLVLAEVLEKNNDILSGECYSGERYSGFFAIIEAEYYNGGSDWYDYICENSLDEAKQYVIIHEESLWPDWRK